MSMAAFIDDIDAFQFQRPSGEARHMQFIDELRRAGNRDGRRCPSYLQLERIGQRRALCSDGELAGGKQNGCNGAFHKVSGAIRRG